MNYEIIKHTDGLRVTNPDGNEIYRFEGEGYYQDEIQEAVLEDANFGNPQKAALKTLLGLLPVETLDEPLP